MATITSLGAGSGINAESIVTQLMSLEQRPLTQLQSKQDSTNTKISAYGTISSLLDTLKNASNTLGTPSSLAAFKASSSVTNVLSSTSSSLASAGTYAIKVQQLATAHKMSHDTAITGDTSAVINSSGSNKTFTLQIAGGTSTPLTLATGATLGDLRDAINNSTAGVTANIVTDSTSNSSKLIFNVSETGKAITTISTDLSGFGSFNTLGGENGKDAILSTTAFTGGSEILGDGNLNITVGGATVTVAIAGAASLNSIASQITASSAGVTASVITDSTGTHLKMVAKNADLKVSYTAEDTNGSDSYNFSRLNGFADAGDPLQIAQSAKLTIEGQSITSTSNTVTSAIKGVSLSLAQTGTTTLTVARDQTAVTTAVDTFVSAYNALNSKIRSLTAYDATNKKANTLTGDSTTRNIQNQLSSILTSIPGTPSGAYKRLSDIGISTGKDGGLSVDSAKLKVAIDADFSSVSNVLNSYGSALSTKISEFTTTNGLLAGKTGSLSTMVKEYEKQKESIQLRLTAIEKRYRAQFSSLDTMVASMQQTSTFLTQQLAKF